MNRFASSKDVGGGVAGLGTGAGGADVEAGSVDGGGTDGGVFFGVLCLNRLNGCFLSRDGFPFSFGSTNIISVD